LTKVLVVAHKWGGQVAQHLTFISKTSSTQVVCLVGWFVPEF
jgi:hypothetical protein